MKDFFIKIGAFFTKSYYRIITYGENTGPTSWYNPPLSRKYLKDEGHDEEPFKIYSHPKFINFRTNKLSKEPNADLLAFSESPITPNILNERNNYLLGGKIELHSIILAPTSDSIVTKFIYDTTLKSRSALWETSLESCKSFRTWKHLQYKIARVLREEQSIRSLRKTGLIKNEKEGSENLEKFMKSPALDILGESSGYKRRWVTETTAILPPKSEKYDLMYKLALKERSNLRATRLMLTLSENTEEAEARLFKLVEGYYKVDAFEKKYLFGMKRSCSRLFVEPLEVTNPSEFIHRTFSHWPDYAYKRASIVDAYNALRLPESLFLGDPEGSAVEALEDAAASEVADLREIVVDSVTNHSFWALITIGTILTAVYFARRSAIAEELIDGIKDL